MHRIETRGGALKFGGGVKMKRSLAVLVFLFCALVAFSGQTLYAQLADRAEITGLVTDTSGAGVPDAKVTLTNQETRAKIVVGPNRVSNLRPPPLSLGN